MERDRQTLVFVLLVLQASLALVSTLGLVVYVGATHAGAMLALPELLALGGAGALLLLAIGRWRGWRWAVPAVVAYEVLTLLGTGVAILASRGQALNLTVALSGIAVPLGIIVVPPLPRERLVVGLLLVTGVVHLALAPEHLAHAPTLGALFILDGTACIGLALLSVRVTWWRRPAALLMAASIAAYVGVLLRGSEGVEDLATATKLVEIVALGLLLAGRRRWVMPAFGVVLATVLTGTVAWGVELRGGAGHDEHHGPGTVVQAVAPPTSEQRAAAARLIDATRDGIARYADLDVALADGYVPSTPPRAPTVHYANPAYVHDGHVLDPLRPEELVYANTPHGPLLLGAMYMMPNANEPGPAIGGSLTEWHIHTNLCFALPSRAIGGFLTPFGTCPPGSINAPTPAMLHVWTVANPAGPFGELPPAYVARLTGGRA
jgi:hypothetical protein